MPERKNPPGESFAGNVMKYSVATYLGFAITGLALIVKGLLPAEVLGAPVTFMTYTATVMNLGILGLDQTLLRFYHEPPAGAEPRQLFAACTRMSVVFMLVLGAVCSLFAARPMAVAFGFGADGQGLVPLLFVNAALYMLVRYLNVLLRLENDLKAYTAETLWMQGCFNLIYLLPGFFTSNVYLLAMAAIISFGVVVIAFGYKYRSAFFSPLPAEKIRRYRQGGCALWHRAGPGADSVQPVQRHLPVLCGQRVRRKRPGTLCLRLQPGAAGHRYPGGLLYLLGPLCVRPLPRGTGAHRPRARRAEPADLRLFLRAGDV